MDQETLRGADGEYRIYELIASGGFASVFYGRDTATNVPVAVKRLHPHLTAQAGVVERFEQEAATVRGLTNEHIVRMIDQGRDEEEAAVSLGASGWSTFFRVTLPNIKWALLYGVLLCNARAMGEFGAVSVVSGHIRGLTNTMPLHVEVLYNDYQYVGAFAVASVLALLALVTLTLKTFLEWHFADEIAAGHKH